MKMDIGTTIQNFEQDGNIGTITAQPIPGVELKVQFEMNADTQNIKPGVDGIQLKGFFVNEAKGTWGIEGADYYNNSQRGANDVGKVTTLKVTGLG